MEFIGICLITNNVSALANFYSKILNVEKEGNDIHAEIKTEGSSLAIFSKGEMEKMAPGSMNGAGFGSFVIEFIVKDVDKEYERLKKLNIEVVKQPETHPWGYRSFWFKDPDGNVINFTCKVTNNNI